MLYLWDLNGTKVIFFKCYLLILVFGNRFMIEIVLLVIGVVVVRLLLLVVVVVKGLSALL